MEEEVVVATTVEVVVLGLEAEEVRVMCPLVAQSRTTTGLATVNALLPLMLLQPCLPLPSLLSILPLLPRLSLLFCQAQSLLQCLRLFPLWCPLLCQLRYLRLYPQLYPVLCLVWGLLRSPLRFPP